MFDSYMNQLPDIDPDETQEWIESLDQLIDASPARARYLMHQVMTHARSRQIGLPAMVSTDYINTISAEQEPHFPGDEEIEHSIRRIIRWNAAAMVMRANKKFDGIGGHISTYASAASLYEVGFNHFFRGRDAEGGGDHVFSRAMRPRASMPAPSSRAASTSPGSTTSAGRPSAEGCPPTPTRVSCPSTGSSPRFRWA